MIVSFSIHFFLSEEIFNVVLAKVAVWAYPEPEYFFRDCVAHAVFSSFLCKSLLSTSTLIDIRRDCTALSCNNFFLCV